MDRSALRLQDPIPGTPREERRRTIRQRLHTPVYVSFNGPQSGMVVDLSELLDLHENGFAVQTALPTGAQRVDHLEVNHPVTLCLDLPETRKYVHGSGQVVWADETGRAGVRFSLLPDGARQILKEWLFANLLIASTNHAARAEQLAHRQRQDSPVPDSSPADQSPAPAMTPILVPATVIPVAASTEPASASPDRAELLSALDDLRSQVHDLEIRDLSADGDAILRLITEQAMSLTGATGAALALFTDDKMFCRARAGDPAPPLGSKVDLSAGLSGECIRSGRLVACQDPGTDPRVDAEVCRMLGIGSFMAAPIFDQNHVRVVGLLEVFFPHPNTFAIAQETILDRLVELVPQSEQEANQKPEQTSAQTSAPLAPKSESRSEDKKIENIASAPEPYRATTIPARQVEQIPSAVPVELEVNGATSPMNRLGSDVVVPPGEPEQDSDDLLATATSRRPHLGHLGLLLLALGTVAMVLGYLLAPAIERRWMGPAQSSQSSGQSLGQRPGQGLGQSPGQGPQPASSLSASASMPVGADRRGHIISPSDLRKLADRGDADAQYQLGILYHDGDAIPKSDAEAVQWFRRAAEQGYVRAQSTLGAYYWAGHGVPQDFSKAYFWSQLALAQGDENSKSRLEGLSAQMTKAQVASAREQAEAWLHSHNQTANSRPR